MTFHVGFFIIGVLDCGNFGLCFNGGICGGYQGSNARRGFRFAKTRLDSALDLLILFESYEI